MTAFRNVRLVGGNVTHVHTKINTGTLRNRSQNVYKFFKIKLRLQRFVEDHSSHTPQSPSDVAHVPLTMKHLWWEVLQRSESVKSCISGNKESLE